MSFGGIQSLWTRITEKHDVSAVAGQRMLADGIYSAHEAAEYSVAVGAVKCQRGIYGISGIGQNLQVYFDIVGRRELNLGFLLEPRYTTVSE